jgi:bacterioferritin-associated ferredoxin
MNLLIDIGSHLSRMGIVLSNISSFLQGVVMFVCVCHAVTDHQIRAAAEDGARTLKDLRRDLGVTRDCGQCASCALKCLEEVHGSLRKSPRGNRLAVAA